ncbi:MAG: bifunctional folylpolyglutamate synthase/dihydrofolate synthase [Planctomycetes bacterium]|nr:bifunctional folylpolyglutamate synthase/dihydrofolate synthase [Planctomycetota bacterium]
MPFRTFRQAYDYLARFTDYERMSGGRYTSRTYNLRRMRSLLDALEHPECRFDSVHIAGTKGKGSTAIITEALFRAHGWRTGLYTSPHLMHMLERIRIDGQPVRESEFVRAMNRMRPALDRIRPTYFEIMTAAAFLIFAARKVDIAVLEVGLGGRLDATNVVTPRACAIARVGYDHTDKLGKTLARIAAEKAGIIKAGVPAFTSETNPEALGALRRRARKVGSPLVGVARDVRDVGATPAGVAFSWNGRKLRLPVLGEFQAENAALALNLTRWVLGALNPRWVSAALARVRLPARVEIVRRRPTWIVDVAHNPLSMKATLRALGRVPRRRTICVFGASQDKDYAGMMRALDPKVDLWIVTRSSTPRACPPEILEKQTKKTAVRTERVSDAVDLARKLAGPRDLVLVTGSFYVAGEALATPPLGGAP